MNTYTLKSHQMSDDEHLDCHIFNISGHLTKIPHTHLTTDGESHNIKPDIHKKTDEEQE